MEEEAEEEEEENQCKPKSHQRYWSNPPSELLLHRPLQRFIPIQGTASLEDTFEDPEACQNSFSGCHRHGST
eukprot:7392768-Pyramimonas_sp.AAC.1